MRNTSSLASSADPSEILFTRLARKLYRGRVTTSDMRYAVLLCALAHWPDLEATYLAYRRYAALEGLNVVELWERKIADQVRRKR